ncbi:hypothetical protein Peur_039280 [Populus x canadensis]
MLGRFGERGSSIGSSSTKVLKFIYVRRNGPVILFQVSYLKCYYMYTDDSSAKCRIIILKCRSTYPPWNEQGVTSELDED